MANVSAFPQSFPRFSALAAILGCILFFCFDPNDAASNDHPIHFKPGQSTAYGEGQFSKRVHEVYFSFYAHDGQHLVIKIKPLTPDLITAGVVIYPSGKQDGGPGGTVFDSDLTETGNYRIRVTQRQPETNGRFRVLVRISAQRKAGASDGN
jgi:hypothetical protein